MPRAKAKPKKAAAKNPAVKKVSAKRKAAKKKVSSRKTLQSTPTRKEPKRKFAIKRVCASTATKKPNHGTINKILKLKSELQLSIKNTEAQLRQIKNLIKRVENELKNYDYSGKCDSFNKTTRRTVSRNSPRKRPTTKKAGAVKKKAKRRVLPKPKA